MELNRRKTNISLIGEVPWGTHFCLFYDTKEDLIDTLIPYFKAGLENNEYCMWITSEPLTHIEAEKLMKESIPDFENYKKRKQIEILPHDLWYILNNEFDSTRVLDGWVSRLEHAIEMGFEGLRLTGNTFWLEDKDWNSFNEYEKEVNNVIGNYKMLAICTYSIKKCSTSEIIDVVHSHQFAVIRRKGKWEIFKNMEQIKAEKKYRTLFESSADGIGLLDMEGNIIDCNLSLCQTTGYDKEELLSLNFRDITPQKWIFKEQELINKQVLTNGFTEAYEKELIGKNGNIIPMSVRIWLKRDEERNPTGMWAFLRDITERKKAERKLKHLITTVSHELRTPLTIITSSVENLKSHDEKISKEDKNMLLDMIYSNTNLLNEIIEDILLVSKLDEKKVDMHWSNFCPLEVCNKVIKIMDLRLKAKKLTVSLKIPEDLQIFADKRIINQLFQILIDNAIKYSNKNSEIEINMKDDFVPHFNTFYPKGVLFEIKDHGIGIKVDEKPNVFKRFFRSNEVDEIPGTGLGLSIAKELALLHEGKLFVDSEYGKGSTFSLFLPKKD